MHLFRVIMPLTIALAAGCDATVPTPTASAETDLVASALAPLGYQTDAGSTHRDGDVEVTERTIVRDGQALRLVTRLSERQDTFSNELSLKPWVGRIERRARTWTISAHDGDKTELLLRYTPDGGWVRRDSDGVRDLAAEPKQRMEALIAFTLAQCSELGVILRDAADNASSGSVGCYQPGGFCSPAYESCITCNSAGPISSMPPSGSGGCCTGRGVVVHEEAIATREEVACDRAKAWVVQTCHAWTGVSCCSVEPYCWCAGVGLPNTNLGIYACTAEGQQVDPGCY